MRDVIVLPDPASVVEATAQRLVSFLLESQSLTSPIHVALTGGDTGIAVLERVRANTLLGAVSWPDVHFWWGDERFVAAGGPDRNDWRAHRALLDHLPEAAGGIHPVASPDQGLSLVQAARDYTAELRRHQVVFSLVLLGVGPDGHVASIFPGAGDGAGIEVPGAFAVPDSPKPPPARVSLTLDTINAAAQVWLVAAGQAKRNAVAAALSAPPAPAPAALAGTAELVDPSVNCPVRDGQAASADTAAPAALAAGRDRTLWLVDAAAAGAAA
ncbi:MAG: 6-phosphogluconolactonase [Bifidobacteriaceae bacterium]|jgi:6-phosphogluconolactonase|nr:6-phosphogluconolactonase [Bifidobacteriaceae bacterium]